MTTNLAAPLPGGSDDPALRRIADQILGAKAPLAIRGGGTKHFYGEAVQGEPLDVSPLSGISSYEPTELVVTVRAGTPLAELEAALAEKGQCLPFEPPRFASTAHPELRGGTVGGMVASGLAGPSRAAVGGVRDYVLGATMLNGRAELMSFGGQVMKNVAGYDVSRLLAGSMGILGVICEVSLKVLPVAPASATLCFLLDEATAIRRLNEWGGLPLPINASAWRDGHLYVRLRGARAAVGDAQRRMGGDLVEPAVAEPLWLGLRDHTGTYHTRALDAVEAGQSLWRLSVPSTVPPLGLAGESLLEHGGAQRWLVTGAPAAEVRGAAARAGGHATLFRTQDKSPGVFAPLASPLDRLHRQLKQAFDPASIFNPGRLYPGL
ncbi:glycolate oxidase subunit GlcE [Aquincola agrisoli]